MDNRKLKLSSIAFILLIITLITTSFIINHKKAIKMDVAIELVRMKTFYTNYNNPIKIAVSDYKTSDLDVSIDNGTIHRQNDEFIVKPEFVGKATITISHQDQIISQSTYNVKDDLEFAYGLKTPNNTYKLGRVGGNIYLSKEEIKKLESIEFVSLNSNFEIPVEVVSFNLYGTINDKVKESSSNSRFFTKEQKTILTNSKSNIFLVTDVHVVNKDDESGGGIGGSFNICVKE